MANKKQPQPRKAAVAEITEEDPARGNVLLLGGTEPGIRWRPPSAEAGADCLEFFATRNSQLNPNESEALYALDPSLLDLLASEVPDLLNAEELVFENSFSQESKGATFCGFFTPHANWFFDDAHFPSIERRSESSEVSMRLKKIEEKQTATNEKATRLLEQEAEKSGLPKLAATRTQLNKERAELEKKRKSYAGWLIRNLAFRTELARLRERWHAQVRELGGIPPHPRWFQEVEVPEDKLPCVEDLFGFFRRWNLDGLATWDMPIPMNLKNLDYSWDWLDYMKETGQVIYLPWYLQRGSQLDLKSVVERMQMRSTPSHLQGWIRIGKHKGQKREFGEQRLQELLWLHRTHTLVISARMNTRGKLERIYQCYAKKLKTNVDQIRKYIKQLKDATPKT